MATIVKRKSKYSVVYTYYDEQGEKRQKWETWGTYKEAQKRKAEIEFKQSNKTFVRPSVRTVSDLLYDFVELYGVSKWALSTYDAKKGLIDNYINPMIGNKLLTDITSRFMDEFYQKLLKVKSVPKHGQEKLEQTTMSPRNVKEVHKILRCAFNLAVKWEYLVINPALNATLPKVEATTRATWTEDDLIKALVLCDDDRLKLGINLAFNCSLRMGELVGLTWDNVDISEESIKTGMASIFIEQELMRVSKNALEKLERRDVVREFPAVLTSNNTVLVLKRPKTKSSIRRIFLSESVIEMLIEWKKGQEELKELLGSEYYDYGLVLPLSNGRPLEGSVLTRSFKKFIRSNNLPPVVFHSIRHTSTTVKLRLTGGDVKSVQGDTGHAQMKMVSDVYSHIWDEHRVKNAVLLEDKFYSKLRQAEGKEPLPETMQQPTESEKVMQLLEQSPELASQLLQLLTAQAQNQVQSPSVD